MLSLLAALALSSPVPVMILPPPCRWYSRAMQACRDDDVEYLGPWDPRPNPSEWQYSTPNMAPPDFGAYPTEKEP